MICFGIEKRISSPFLRGISVTNENVYVLIAPLVTFEALAWKLSSDPMMDIRVAILYPPSISEVKSSSSVRMKNVPDV